MEQTKVPVKTWICGDCRYRWQFSGEAINTTPYDLSAWQLEQQFPEPQFKGLQAGKCPNCHLRGVQSPLGLEIDPANMSSITVASDEEIESRQVEEVDEHGNPVMEQVDERYELRVNPKTGEIYSELVPVMQQKVRSLTEVEVAELKQQRDQSESELEKIAA